MKLNEVLPSLLSGKKITRESFPDDAGENYILALEDLYADDWVVKDEKESP